MMDISVCEGVPPSHVADICIWMGFACEGYLCMWVSSAWSRYFCMWGVFHLNMLLRSAHEGALHVWDISVCEDILTSTHNLDPHMNEFCMWQIFLYVCELMCICIAPLHLPQKWPKLSANHTVSSNNTKQVKSINWETPIVTYYHFTAYMKLLVLRAMFQIILCLISGFY